MFVSVLRLPFNPLNTPLSPLPPCGGGEEREGEWTLCCQTLQFENPAEQRQQSASNPDIRLAPRIQPPSVPPLHHFIDGEDDGMKGGGGGLTGPGG